MDEPPRFSTVLRNFLKRSPYAYGQLAKRSGLPKTTISNWANEYVKRPRDWRDLAKLAGALELNEVEATELFTVADYPSVEELWLSAENEADQLQLAPWAKEIETRLTGNAPFQAPPTMLDFVGRTAALTELKEMLIAGGNICMLHGMGGVGKTTLATHLAYSLRPYFPDGILWAQLDNAVLEDNTLNTNRLMAILREFAQPFGYDLSEAADILSRSEAMRKVLADRRVLIVLDNANGTQVVEPLLPSTGSPSTLITTRNRKMLTDRAVSFEITPFDHQESLSLFTNVIGSRRIEDESRAIAEIIRFTGGLPLALRVVAEALAETEQLTFSEYRDLLQDERTRLEYLEDWEDASKNVRASLELSYKRLSKALQTFFLQLVLFENNHFTAEAVTAVTETPLIKTKTSLARLKSLSLVEEQSRVLTTEPETAEKPEPFHTYRLHPLWRTFAHEKVPHIPQRLNENYVAYYLQFARTHTEKEAAVYNRLEAELPNLLQAVEKAYRLADSQSIHLMGQYLIQDSEFLNARAYYREAIQLLSRSLTLQERKGEEEKRPWTLNKLAYFAINLGQHETAHWQAETALALAKSAHNLQQQADSLLYLGHVASRQGDSEAALTFWTDELALRQQLNNPSRLANCFNSMGVIQLHLGRYTESERYLDQALTRYRELGETSRVALAMANKGVSALFLGAYANALQSIEESLLICRTINHKKQITQNLLNKGIVQTHLGQFAGAIKSLSTALKQCQEMGDQVYEGLTLNALAETYVAVGDIAAANSLLQQVAAHLQEAPSEWIEIDYLHVLGLVYQADSSYEQSLQSFQQMHDIADAIGYQYYLAQSKLGMVHAHMALGGKDHLDQATTKAQAALDLCQALRLKGTTPRAHAYLGKTYLLSGVETPALQHGQKAIDLLAPQQYIHGSEIEIYLFGLQIFEALAMQEAYRTHLIQAQQRLMKTADDQIEDAAQRQLYLDTPVNREVIHLFKAEFSVKM